MNFNRKNTKKSEKSLVFKKKVSNFAVQFNFAVLIRIVLLISVSVEIKFRKGSN